MALYNKGDKVIRISSNDKGIIVGIGPCGRGGRQLYKVNYNGIETDLIFLTVHELDLKYKFQYVFCICMPLCRCGKITNTIK